MKKIRINNLQLGALIYSTISSFLIGLGTFNSVTICKIDAYISFILQALINFIPLLLLIYIANYEPSLNIIEKVNKLFGKYIGFIINSIMFIIISIVTTTYLFSISNFTISQFLSHTPTIYIAIMFAIICIYALSKGIETISRTSLALISLTFILFIFLAFGISNEVKLDNLKPVLEFGIKKPIIAACLNTFIATAPLYTILIIPKNYIKDKTNYPKTIIISYVIGMLFCITLVLMTSAVLGKYLLTTYQYPEYIVLKKITMFNFIDRIENLISVQWIFSIFSTISLLFYYLTNSIKKNDKPKKISIFIITIIAYLSTKVFKNNTTYNYYITNIYPYILSIATLIIIIIALTILLKKVKQ